jgi:hypothetical protein
MFWWLVVAVAPGITVVAVVRVVESHIKPVFQFREP